jgi:uncharacterized membrane protein YphA (DoxX/SURF4 family)
MSARTGTHGHARPLLTRAAPAPVLLIRLVAGGVFLSEGIQKFLFPDQLGVGRFIRIGIPAPAVMAPFVGVVEIVGGMLLLLGLLTRLAALALLINITVAILSTKVPMLLAQGFWATAHEARTDWSMFWSSLFLLLVGAGPWSLDAAIDRRGTARPGRAPVEMAAAPPDSPSPDRSPE